ncbi:Probable inactive ATP-dependent zinc metalloprotease FTSHI 3, chloroplastic [Linum perenne]
MSAFSLVCSIGSLRTKENSGTFSVKPRPVTRYSAAFSHYLIPSVQLCKTQQFSPCTKKLVRSASSENNGVRLLGFGLGYRSWHGFSCSNRIGPLVSSNNGVEPTQLRKGISKLRKRFSLRLRPRLRLLTMRMKRIRVRSVLSEFILFLKKNLRRVVLYASISIGLAMCYLFLRLAAEPSSKIVPYSDFIACLQNGSVSEVLLVEESRGIYYNIDSQGTLINPNSDDQSLSTAVSNEYVGSSVAVEGIALEDQSKAVAVSNGNTAGSVVVEGVAAPQTSRVNQFGKVLKPRESKPKWEFATRKMDHDDKFLLSLLREKGATYRSAPQSVWMSMSGLLLTIIALWIPLTPLMWLLHRQLSANNSLAKKRRPTNRTVTFNDVDGVDAAKAELIELSDYNSCILKQHPYPQ